MDDKVLTTFKEFKEYDSQDEEENKSSTNAKRNATYSGTTSKYSFSNNEHAQILTRSLGFVQRMRRSSDVLANSGLMYNNNNNNKTSSKSNLLITEHVNDANNSKIITVVQSNPKASFENKNIKPDQYNSNFLFNQRNNSNTKMNEPDDKISIASSSSTTSFPSNTPITSGNEAASSSSQSQQEQQIKSPTKRNNSIASTLIGTTNDKYNLPNVLKHIYALKYTQKSNQAASNSNTNQSNDTSKQFWMPDDQVKECFECNDKFTTFRRRHHCRVCGQIFCGKCSDYEIPSHLIWPNSTGNIRACTFCHSFVGQMETGDIKHNTKSIRELMKRLSLSSSTFYYPDQTNNTGLAIGSNASSIATNQSSNQSALSNLLSLSNSKLNNSAANLNPNSNLNHSNNMNNMNNGNPNNPISNLMTNSIGQSSATLTPPGDDNNPFDVTENKDYFKSQDMEIKQLIINNSLELRNLWIQIYHTSDGLTFQTRNINKFKKINNCITGTELVEWLMKKKSVSKDQAIVIGQALVDGKFMELAYQNNSVNNSANSLTSYYTNSSYNSNMKSNQNMIFHDDNSFYKPGSNALNCNRIDSIEEKKKEIHDTDEGPEWIKELNKLVTVNDDAVESNLNSSSASSLSSLNTIDNLNIKQTSNNQTNNQEVKTGSSLENEQPLSSPLVKNEAPIMKNLTIISSGTPSISMSPVLSKSSSLSSLNTLQPQLIANKFSQQQQTHIQIEPPKTLNNVNDNLQHVHKQIQIEILKQLLKLKNVSFDWFDIIMPLAWKCVDLVKPDVKHDNDFMDIRNYVKIKKLPGNSKEDCRIINGLVFTKNVAHKHMKNNLQSPKILLLRSSIEYQRTEEKMCSLEPLFAAESQYLKNYCSKLLLRQNPDVLIVEKSVARIAQEYFLQAGISLILNVKSTIMDKLCRFLQADPMYSIDDLIRKPKLGFCSKFHVETFKMPNDKTKSLMFFEGTPTNLGCTVLLSGASSSELAIIKSLTRFMIYVAYNSKLEQSFILDKYADFTLKNTLFDVKNDQTFSYESDVSLQESQEKKKNRISITKSNEITKKSIESASDADATPKNKISKEISIDQSPLMEVKYDETKIEHEYSITDSSNNRKSNEIYSENNLKLEICEQHLEKNSNNLNRNFKLLIDDLLLSISPFINFQMPYLLLENSNDTLKGYLPKQYMNYLKSNILLQDYQTSVISSIQSSESSSTTSLNKQTDKNLNENINNKLHEFLLLHLTKSFNDEEIKRIYADYKSRGGMVSNVPTKRLMLTNIDSNPKLSAKGSSNKQLKDSTYDCLDIFNRQHLVVLFCSQCEVSPVYPNICHRPKVIDMKFYGENDMTLGSFLARNCFRNGYKCNNESCDTLIVYHTRSFVHADSKITIRMSIVPTASASVNSTPNVNSTLSNQTNNNSLVSSSSTNTQSSSSTKDEASIQSSPQQQQFSNLSVSALYNNTQNPTNNKTTVKSNNQSSNILSIHSLVASSTSSSSSSNAASSSQPLVSNQQLTNKPESINQSNTQNLQAPVQQPAQQQQNNNFTYDDINIFMWSVCKICNKSTKKIPMAPDTWSFSLAKFLELTFHAKNFTQFNNDDENKCKHSLFQDHYQYFRFKNIVTVFSTSKITIRSLNLPPVILKQTGPSSRSRSDYIDEIKELTEKGLVLFSTLCERIASLKALNLNEKQIQKLESYIVQINGDSTLKHKIEAINLMLTNPSMSTNNKNPSSALTLSTPINPSISLTLASGEIMNNDNENQLENNPSTASNDSVSARSRPSSTNLSISNSNKGELNFYKIDMLLIDLRKYIASSTVNWNTKINEFFKKSKFDDDNVLESQSLNIASGTVPIEIPKYTKQLSHKDDEAIPGKIPTEPIDLLGTYSALNETSNNTTKSSFDQANHAISNSSNNNASIGLDDDHKLGNNLNNNLTSQSSAISLGKRFIANLIPSSAYHPMKVPFPDDEHYLVNNESSYYVNDKNLSSIVAFTLGSKEYREFLLHINKPEINRLSTQASQLVSSSPQVQTSTATKDNLNLINSALQDLDEFDVESASSVGSHFEYQFHDSTTKFYCKVYHAELFSRLRKLIMPNDEEQYIHSLFRCMNWEAKGGKSNLQFRKTLDNRFVLKEMSKQEVQSFVEFAPQYAQYVTNSIQNKKPTALAKILGAYRICLMKNTTIASKAVKMDVIVLENLFYTKKCTQVFDLKGSERNRLVQQTNKQEKDIVLLDENFLQWSFDNPIYIKPHSKYVLMKAIESDSQFLSSKFVMDYSLLCGFDQVNNEIVVGIIDYLRVFTWDKKVETYLKKVESTISGQGKMPTIVSPEVYSKRFIHAIERYFLEVPDQWYQDPSQNLSEEN